MIDFATIAPLLVSGLAMLLALVPFPGIERLRLVAVLLALGCGQIYIAVLAFTVLFIIDNNWRIDARIPPSAWLTGALLVGGILITTAVNAPTERTYVELAQLSLYIILLLLVLSYLKTGADVLRMLQASVMASTLVTVIALVSVALGFQSAPQVFLARGPNEGAVFLSLMGVVPAAVLFVRNRNPVYALLIALFIYVETMATARGSLAVSALAVIAAGFFLFRNLAVRAVLLAAGVYVLVVNIPVLSAAFQGQLNFSTRERLALADHGQYLWLQHPLSGWGWGSTTWLAEQTPTTQLVYPHFHNTYVQLVLRRA